MIITKKGSTINVGVVKIILTFFAKKYRALGKSILENTHCNLRRNLLMLCNNYYIKKLIGFKGIILEQLETSSDSMSFSFSLEIKTHNYPKCHQQTSKVHDYRIQMIKDISISGKKTYLYYKKRRYVCNHCNKKFYKKMIFSPAIKE